MDRSRASGWQLPALLGMAVAGLLIALYLTATHAGSVPLVCTVGSFVNCASVTRSAYSVVPGTTIPISILGVVWFVVAGLMAAAPLVALRTGRPEPAWLPPVHLAWAGLGLIAVLYLVYVEVVLLHQICEWCTVVHLLVIATVLLTLRRVQQR
jgi:uncharacterized membrane protein